MIKALQALGGSNTIHLILSYSGGNVTVTATIVPNDEDRQDERRVIQVSGTVDEVDANLPQALAATVTEVATFQTNLAAVEAENKKALEEARSKVASSSKPAPKAKKPEAKPEPKAEPAPAPEPVATTAELSLESIINEANAKK